jgi:signal transduction histidine kinase
MVKVYFYLVLLNAAVSVAAGVAVVWKNREQAVGPLFGATMLLFAAWLGGFAQYFHPMDESHALAWAKITLSATIVLQAVWFQTLCALAGKMRQFKWWIAGAYLAAAVFLGLVWAGVIVTGLKRMPFMNHYVYYDRTWYPWLVVHLTGWEWLGAGIVFFSARRMIGYRRNTSLYFLVAWLIIFLTTHSIIIPIEYNINIQPFGFLVLPINLAWLAYVMARARLTEFNVAISRMLVYGVALLIVVGVAGIMIAMVQLRDPAFLSGVQTPFVLILVTAIGTALSVILPRLVPKAERALAKTLFGAHVSEGDYLRPLVGKISSTATVDDLILSVLDLVLTSLHVRRAVLYLRDDLSSQIKLAGSLGAPRDRSDATRFREESPVVKWITTNRDCLVFDELPRRAGASECARLQEEMNHLDLTVVVPMILEDYLVGFLGLGEKQMGDMFFLSDLEFLETVATETALALRYRKMQEEVFRKNKLVELGTIAAGVAHEIRNPLASVRTFAQLLPERVDDPEFRNEFSKLVLKDIDRITRVVESMLAFARPSQVSVASHSIVELVEEALLLAQARLRSKSIQLFKEYHSQPVIQVDKQQILQVLVNLLINAVDAVRENGEIRISTGVRWMENDENGNARRQVAVIEVADNGPGIPSAVRSRLFDPFFTTKKDGTGLGLSISQKIARDHGGVITVSSVEGKGAAFQVNLPVS